jgi:hypothetical protein
MFTVEFSTCISPTWSGDVVPFSIHLVENLEERRRPEIGVEFGIKTLLAERGQSQPEDSN